MGLWRPTRSKVRALKLQASLDLKIAEFVIKSNVADWRRNFPPRFMAEWAVWAECLLNWSCRKWFFLQFKLKWVSGGPPVPKLELKTSGKSRSKNVADFSNVTLTSHIRKVWVWRSSFRRTSGLDRGRVVHPEPVKAGGVHSLRHIWSNSIGIFTLWNKPSLRALKTFEN